MTKKRRTKKAGVVRKIIKSGFQPEKAQIEIEDAEHLYREIRVENKVETENGEPAKLKPGAPVEVIIEADEKDTLPATDEQPRKDRADQWDQLLLNGLMRKSRKSRKTDV